MNRMWIFGSARNDFAVMYAAGLLSFVFVWTVPSTAFAATILGLVTLAVIDTGHMLTTIWRTHLRAEERRSNGWYVGLPLLVFATIGLWAWLRIPYLFNVLLYGTIWHHMRQYFGVMRWYEKLNRRSCRPSHWFIHLLFLLPLGFAHFRTDGIKQIFYRGDVLVYPSEPLFRIFVGLYALTVIAWVGYELYLWRRGVREPNRMLAILVPMLFTGVGCLYGNGTMQVILPLIWTHGVSYFGLLALSLRRLDPERWKTATWAAVPIVVSAAVLGGAAFYVDEAFLETEYLSGLGLGDILVIAALQTPSVCHYVFDMWIWTGRHREAKVVFASGPPIEATASPVRRSA